MPHALRKSPIPDTHTFVIRELKEPYFDPNWHFHQEYQLFVVLKGSGTRFVGDHIKSFEEGDVVFTGPNLPHLWRSDVIYFDGNPNLHTHGIVVYFQEHFPGKELIQKEEAIHLRHFLERSKLGLEILGKSANKITQMMQELLRKKGLESVIFLLQILNEMMHSEEIYELSSTGYTNSLKDGDTEIMNLIHAYVMDNFKNKISLKEVASIANMTPTSFSRYFKMHANKTFSELVSEVRIGYACRLLIEKKMNVSQACYESGYQTLTNFNRQFKALMKRTPLQYKKEYEDTPRTSSKA
ncbi:AraC family transcriptional regulator [Catalinimonas sp. 4WD22]|uniref:AraC family transcriptional regulator n=1 Tax=Catalinimonas locisalis TaxID=3133978 RepID=UPI0031018362